MISVKNISKSWTKDGRLLEVLDNISFEINENDFVSIIGPSGCGKTTLLKLLVGLYKSDDGFISYKNKALTNSILPSSSIMFQESCLLPWRNVKENIALPLELKKDFSENFLDKLITLVGLKEFEYFYPNQLSGGMKQRTSLARALLTRPKILLLDEPFASLDELTRDKLQEDLLNLKKMFNCTVILVTHSISEAVYFSNKIIILSKIPSNVCDVVDVNFSCERTLKLKQTIKFQEMISCIKEKLKT